MPMPGLDAVHERYLCLLKVTPAAPTHDLLRTLVAAHLYRVPFENVSKLLLFEREGAGRPLALTEFLDGIEHYDLGGTCYSSNPFLYELLVALGFDAALLGADMSLPNVHTSIGVRVDGAAYHVDVGYAAPFREPIALDDLPHVVTNGVERYVMTAEDASGAYAMSYFVGEEPSHRYVVHPPPRSRAFFASIIVDSFLPGKTFMQCLRLSRQFADGSADLRDRRLVVHRGRVRSERIVTDLADLRRVVDDVFGMPRCPVEQGVRILEGVSGVRLFD